MGYDGGDSSCCCLVVEMASSGKEGNRNRNRGSLGAVVGEDAVSCGEAE